MAAGAAQAVGPRLAGGLVIAPGITERIPGIDVVTGGHPVPTAASEAAGRRALALAAATGARERLLVLLSGGASALMAVPVSPLTLEDKRQTTARLLEDGADIRSLNAVRKHLSAIKGGRLAATAPAPCRTLAISDVVGDDLSVIGSGPTVGDPTTFRDAYSVLQRFGGVDRYPPRVVAHLERGVAGHVPETPKPARADSAGASGLETSDALVIGTRHTAMEGAADEARRRGYRVVTFDAPVVGEAREAAVSQARRVSFLARSPAGRGPLCVISSGETTVRVKGSGTGGRSQELALALVDAIPPVDGLIEAAIPPIDRPWTVASIGTDGIDGPTDAAGAFGDSTTVVRAAGLGNRPRPFLDDNNAYAFFSALGDLIHLGPTGTNVGDLQVFLLA
jgi:glycerate 2-kinase